MQLIVACVVIVALSGDPVVNAEISGIGLVKDPAFDGSTDQRLQAIQFLVRDGKIAKAEEAIGSFIVDKKNLAHPDIILAQMMISVGKAAQAKQLLERVSGEYPNRLDVLYAFSKVAVSESRWYDGYSIARQANSANAPQHWDNAHAKRMRATLRMIAAACCEKRLAWSDARRLYETQMEDPNTPISLQGLGRCLFQLGEIDAAINAFERYHTKFPDSESAQLAVAKLFEARNDLENAEYHFRRAVKENTQNDRVSAMLSFARWLIWCNRPQDAATVVKHIDVKLAGQVEVEYLQALIARMQQRLDDARQTLAKLHQSTPDSLPISNQYALVLVESENEALRARAMQIALANVRSAPERDEAWSTLGWVQFRLGETESAEQSLNRSMKSGTSQRDAAFFLANVKEKLGQFEVAEKLAKAARSTLGPTFYELDKQKP